MSTLFHKLQVSAVKRETADAVTVSFHVPENLKQEFNYKHGQYLTLQIYVNGVRHRRAYSICSSPQTGEELAVTVKKLDGGVVSTYINNELKAGDTIEVFHPMGKFTIPLDSSQKRDFLLICAGSGITPIMSIMKSVLKSEGQSRVFLIYGNRDQDCIIFGNEISKLEQEFSGRLKVVHLLSKPQSGWTGISGRIDRDSTSRIISGLGIDKVNSAEYFVCGPTGMMEQVKAALGSMQVPSEKIHIEYFTSPISIGDEKEEVTAPKVTESEDGDGKLKIILNGESYDIEVEKGETILDAALRQDVDPPFACQMGICTTCRAKLLSGKVEMEEREGLTDDEIDEGYILTCQSHPRSSGIIVEYE